VATWYDRLQDLILAALLVALAGFAFLFAMAKAWDLLFSLVWLLVAPLVIGSIANLCRQRRTE
jgi:hypothetical protein